MKSYHVGEVLVRFRWGIVKEYWSFMSIFRSGMFLVVLVGSDIDGRLDMNFGTNLVLLRVLQGFNNLFQFFFNSS